MKKEFIGDLHSAPGNKHMLTMVGRWWQAGTGVVAERLYPYLQGGKRGGGLIEGGMGV